MPDEHNKSWDFPNNITLWEKITYLRFKRPNWVNGNEGDDLRILYDNIDRLFTHGIVTWGHIIQVNEELFNGGSDDLPGEVVYSIDDKETVSLIDLEDIAHKLYDLKGQEPNNPQLSPIANYLTNEYKRVFGLQVPSMISPNSKCRISTTMFIRKHLPNRRINFTALPIIVHPSEPFIVLPLPYKYWTQYQKDQVKAH